MEICNGEKAIFLEDDLQQLLVLERDQYASLQTSMQERGKLQVAHYWKPRTRNDRQRD